MAMGKKAKDIFAPTAGRVAIGIEATPRTKGRPPIAEAYDKITVCLFKRQVNFLDRVALAIREKTGRNIRRAELIRALVERAADDLDPGKADFEAKVGKLL